jgi:predicted phage terminase large subunit-like protein
VTKSLEVAIPIAPIPGTAQEPFVASKARHPGFFAASGTGKTRMGALKLTMKAIEMGTIPPDEWKRWNQTPFMMACAPTYKMLQKVLIPTYLQIIPKELWDGDYRVSDGYLPLKNGIQIWFASAEDPMLLYGPTLLAFHLDEVCQMVPKVWQVMTFRLRGPLPDGVPGPRQGFVTGTPQGLPHWTYDMWGDPDREVRRDPPAVKRADQFPWWTMNIWENPYQNPEDLAVLASTYEGTAEGRQEMYGEWVAEGEGRLFQPSWFQHYDYLPENIVRVVDSWDTAVEKHEWSSYTVGQTWAITADRQYILLNMFRGKVEYPDLKPLIRENAKFLYGKPLDMPRTILIENKGSGQTAIQELRREGLPVIAVTPPAKDKYDRAAAVSHIVAQGRVLLPSLDFAARLRLPWLRDFEREVFNIPYAGSWDVVDAMTQFLLWAERTRWLLAMPKLGPVRYEVGLTQRRVSV